VPISREREMYTRAVWSTTLFCDHPLIDGALGTRLLAALPHSVEEPQYSEED
jgi:pyruvate/2-oxoglutarate dehydrogenase complex dihydrolipoamide acyltransferase (E2) component